MFSESSSQISNRYNTPHNNTHNEHPGNYWYLQADSSFAPSQWETSLLCNNVSHWLDVSLEPALYVLLNFGNIIHHSMILYK